MFPKKGAIALVTTALALLLLFSFKTPDSVTLASVASTGGSTVATSPIAGATSGTGAATSPTAAPSATAGTSSTAAAQTVTGPVVSTQYGDVEIRATIANGRITAVDAIALPTGGRSGQISSSVSPILASEALTAQSAKINIVSGATYTSQAYAQSLQAALDQAGIASIQTAG